MEKRNQIIYWIATGLLATLMLMSASMYFIRYPMVRETFLFLGFPAFIIYPLAIAKILGIIAIISNKSELLKEWAYAGFFFDFLLAFSAHVIAEDGQFGMAAIALTLLIASRIYSHELSKQVKQ
ncbi:DoxX family protein [Labilibaculum sp.]|uniref:DoxX family protein n=1 Tax=Labilibaculum sp. TaxID=2060723 RepID=UPI003561F58B